MEVVGFQSGFNATDKSKPGQSEERRRREGLPVGRSSFVKGKHAMRQELKEKLGLKEDYFS